MSDFDKKEKISNAKVALYAAGICGFFALIIFLLLGAIIFYEIDSTKKRIEETDKIHNDEKLCGAVKMAIEEVIKGPSYFPDAESGFSADGEWMYVKDIDPSSELGQYLTKFTYKTPAEYESSIQSAYQDGTAHGMRFKIEGKEVEVEIEYSDRNGRKSEDEGVINAEGYSIVR